MQNAVLVRQNICWLNVFPRFYRLIRQQFLTPEIYRGPVLQVFVISEKGELESKDFNQGEGVSVENRTLIENPRFLSFINTYYIIIVHCSEIYGSRLNIRVADSNAFTFFVLT